MNKKRKVKTLRKRILVRQPRTNHRRKNSNSLNLIITREKSKEKVFYNISLN